MIAAPPPEEVIDISFPDVPLTLNVVAIVVVSVPGRMRFLAFVTSLKLIVSKVFAPPIRRLPVDPAMVYVSVPKVFPPPSNTRAFALTLPITMVALAPLKVRFVVVKMFQTLPAPVPVRVQVPLPMVRVRTFELLESNVPQETLNPLALSVP